MLSAQEYSIPLITDPVYWQASQPGGLAAGRPGGRGSHNPYARRARAGPVGHPGRPGRPGQPFARVGRTDQGIREAAFFDLATEDASARLCHNEGTLKAAPCMLNGISIMSYIGPNRFGQMVLST